MASLAAAATHCLQTCSITVRLAAYRRTVIFRGLHESWCVGPSGKPWCPGSPPPEGKPMRTPERHAKFLALIEDQKLHSLQGLSVRLPDPRGS